MIRSWRLFALCALAGLTNTSVAEDGLALEQLPSWARQQFASVAKRRHLEASTRINPFVWRGDFDGDGVQDLAMFVRQVQSTKEGIAILRRTKSTLVIGAGDDFGNGGDDFSWLDMWSVIEGTGAAPDRLLVAKESSASAVIALKGDTLSWQQQGD